MKRKTIFILVFVLLVPIVLAATPWNYLTKGYADTLYCKITGCDSTYGEMFYHNYTGTALNFPLGNTYYTLFFTNSTYSNGFSFQGGFNKPSNLTTNIAGVYSVSFSAEGSGQNNHEYHLALFVNNEEKEKCETVKKMSAGGDINPMGANCIIRLNRLDNITLRIADYSGGGNGIYYGGDVNLAKLAD